MRTKTTSYPKIGKTVHLDLNEVKTPAVLRLAFYDRAIQSGWTGHELQQVKDFLVGKPFEEQLNILEFYCSASESNHLVNETRLQEDVQFLLSHLGKDIHYLYGKPIAIWDRYDWSNYQTLERKATSRIVRKYAFYSNEVREQDKYVVDSPPNRFFDTREEAESHLSPESLKTTNIYPLWIKED